MLKAINLINMDMETKDGSSSFFNQIFNQGNIMIDWKRVWGARLNYVQKILHHFIPWPALMKLISRVRKTEA